MSTRQLMQWIYQAPAQERAEAAALLAKSYIAGDAIPEERREQEATLTVLLDDTSPLVRRALATVLGPSNRAPHHVILSLLQDQADIATIIAQKSPLLVDAELVDLVAQGQPRTQVAVARRRHVSKAVAAAISEVGVPEACTELLHNNTAQIAVFSVTRMAERLGTDASVREALLERNDLPHPIRQQLMTHLSNVLSAFLTTRGWLPRQRALDISRDAVERATLVLADLSDASSLASLVQHLAESGQLTAALLFRALCIGNIAFFEEALVQLSHLPRARVYALVQDRRSGGFQALYRRCGLPESAYAAFKAALDVLAETEHEELAPGQLQFSHRMLRRVLERYVASKPEETDQLLLLLRRYAAEAAREEARRYAVENIHMMSVQKNKSPRRSRAA
jgi:uncharacterized protein (DUF2336 family)